MWGGVTGCTPVSWSARTGHRWGQVCSAARRLRTALLETAYETAELHHEVRAAPALPCVQQGLGPRELAVGRVAEVRFALLQPEILATFGVLALQERIVRELVVAVAVVVFSQTASRYSRKQKGPRAGPRIASVKDS